VKGIERRFRLRGQPVLDGEPRHLTDLVTPANALRMLQI
jgi:hypothetical protein